MDSPNLKEFEFDSICKSFLFENASRDIVTRAVSDPDCTAGVFIKDQRIYTPESFKRSVGYVLSGEIQVYGPGQERPYIINTLSAGSFFGVAALWNKDEEYISVLTAAKRCRILFFSQELLSRLMRENYIIAENYIRFLSNRIRFLNSKIHNLTAGSTEKALANYLLDLAHESGSNSVSCGSISELASKLNVGRASVYRAFDALIGHGQIRKDGRHIDILDISSLSRL